VFKVSHWGVDSRSAEVEGDEGEQRRAERRRMSWISSGGRGLKRVGDFGVRVAAGVRSREDRAVVRRWALEARRLAACISCCELVIVTSRGNGGREEDFGDCVALFLRGVLFCAPVWIEDLCF